MLPTVVFYGVACCVALLYAWFFIQLFISLVKTIRMAMRKKSQINGHFMRQLISIAEFEIFIQGFSKFSILLTSFRLLLFSIYVTTSKRRRIFSFYFSKYHNNFRKNFSDCMIQFFSQLQRFF